MIQYYEIVDRVCCVQSIPDVGEQVFRSTRHVQHVIDLGHERQRVGVVFDLG